MNKSNPNVKNMSCDNKKRINCIDIYERATSKYPDLFKVKQLIEFNRDFKLFAHLEQIFKGITNENFNKIIDNIDLRFPPKPINFYLFEQLKKEKNIDIDVYKLKYESIDPEIKLKYYNMLLSDKTKYIDKSNEYQKIFDRNMYFIYFIIFFFVHIREPDNQFQIYYFQKRVKLFLNNEIEPVNFKEKCIEEFALLSNEDTNELEKILLKQIEWFNKNFDKENKENNDINNNKVINDENSKDKINFEILKKHRQNELKNLIKRLVYKIPGQNFKNEFDLFSNDLKLIGLNELKSTEVQYFFNNLPYNDYLFYKRVSKIIYLAYKFIYFKNKENKPKVNNIINLSESKIENNKEYNDKDFLGKKTNRVNNNESNENKKEENKFSQIKNNNINESKNPLEKEVSVNAVNKLNSIKKNKKANSKSENSDKNIAEKNIKPKSKEYPEHHGIIISDCPVNFSNWHKFNEYENENLDQCDNDDNSLENELYNKPGNNLIINNNDNTKYWGDEIENEWINDTKKNNKEKKNLNEINDLTKNNHLNINNSNNVNNNDKDNSKLDKENIPLIDENAKNNIEENKFECLQKNVISENVLETLINNKLILLNDTIDKELESNDSNYQDYNEYLKLGLLYEKYNLEREKVMNKNIQNINKKQENDSKENKINSFKETDNSDKSDYRILLEELLRNKLIRVFNKDKIKFDVKFKVTNMYFNLYIELKNYYQEKYPNGINLQNYNKVIDNKGYYKLLNNN